MISIDSVRNIALEIVLECFVILYNIEPFAILQMISVYRYVLYTGFAFRRKRSEV